MSVNNEGAIAPPPSLASTGTERTGSAATALADPQLQVQPPPPQEDEDRHHALSPANFLLHNDLLGLRGKLSFLCDLLLALSFK